MGLQAGMRGTARYKRGAVVHPVDVCGCDILVGSEVEELARQIVGGRAAGRELLERPGGDEVEQAVGECLDAAVHQLVALDT